MTITVARRIALLIAIGVVAISCATSPAVPAPDAMPTPDPDARMASYGKVWGFLKYYHPLVATGQLDWDSVLVAEWPRVRQAAAGPRGAFDAAVAKLIDAAGPVTPCATCGERQYDTSAYAQLDLRWIDDSALFSRENAERLRYVRRNRNQARNVYAVDAGNGVLNFSAEKPYPDMVFPAEPYRALLVFRYWNTIHYFFPYKDIIGEDWNGVLVHMLPRIVHAADTLAYQTAVLLLTTRIRDTHAKTTYLPWLHERLFGPYGAPFVDNVRFVEGSMVVTPGYDDTLGLANGSLPGMESGDVITHIDGVSVEHLRAQRAPYVHASNEAALNKDLNRRVFQSMKDSANVTFHRNGREMTQRIGLVTNLMFRPSGKPVAEVAKVLPGNVGYIDMGRLGVAQVDSAMDRVGRTTGIVFDLRSYPRWTWERLMARLSPARKPFAKVTRPDVTFPGVFLDTLLLAGSEVENPNYYRGRVVIVVNEESLSLAEFTAMILRSTPRATVVGSQTAGADGNVVSLRLPGGIVTAYSGLGIFYPDGKPTQRIGIVPDIYVRPTIQGIREGRDEVLERAISLITSAR